MKYAIKNIVREKVRVFVKELKYFSTKPALNIPISGFYCSVVSKPVRDFVREPVRDFIRVLVYLPVKLTPIASKSQILKDFIRVSVRELVRIFKCNLRKEYEKFMKEIALSNTK